MTACSDQFEPIIEINKKNNIQQNVYVVSENEMHIVVYHSHLQAMMTMNAHDNGTSLVVNVDIKSNAINATCLFTKHTTTNILITLSSRAQIIS